MREPAAADDRRFEQSSLSPPATSGPTGAGVVVFASRLFVERPARCENPRRSHHGSVSPIRDRSVLVGPPALAASEEREVGAGMGNPSSKVERGPDRGDAR